MLKFITNLICTIFFILFLEMITYYKDYNEISIIKNYIEDDLKNHKITKDLYFENTKIIIKENNEYLIYLYRDSFFSIDSLKIIKYHGIV